MNTAAPEKKTPKTFEDRYAALNVEQKEAVDTIAGAVMVVAGPGSGKTELLSLRVANILKQDSDVAPANILCLTFTDAAAFNMRSRLAEFMGRKAYHVAIHTFHGFGSEIINRNPEYFYNGADFAPADDVTQIEILEDILNGLEQGNPLRSEHDGTFSYLRAIKQSIEYLKKAGLTPEKFEIILEKNKRAIAEIDPLIDPVFRDRVSKKMAEPAAALVETLKNIGDALPDGFEPFGRAMGIELERALEAMEEQGTAPLTAWKKDWTAKSDDGVVHVADMLDVEKMDAIAAIYRAYLDAMRRAGYFDFNDMILDTISALEKNPALCMTIAEQYPYVLVDEFQDTNGAQMQLLKLLTQDAKTPNIMVVGDDDQAIFKFQGAEVSNVLDFQKTYPGAKLIVLTANYRSTQPILDLARSVIIRGALRLENLIPDLKKVLIAKKDIAPGIICGKTFPSYDLEYQWIAKEAARLIVEENILAREIAVISRNHDRLESIVPFFHAAKVPVAYEREENVLDIQEVSQLITMARFVDSLMRRTEDADDLLPEILSFPFWGLARTDVWQIASGAQTSPTRYSHEDFNSVPSENRPARHSSTQRVLQGEMDDLQPEPEERVARNTSWVRSSGTRPWLLVMKEAGGKMADIANFFIELGGSATYQTAEEVLHELIGGPQILAADDENDDEDLDSTPSVMVREGGPSTLPILKDGKHGSSAFAEDDRMKEEEQMDSRLRGNDKKGDGNYSKKHAGEEKEHEMFSPFRTYYFGKEKFDHARADYLRFLSALRSFFGALREYHQGRPVMVRDMLEFVDMHRANNLSINNQNPFSNAENAVQFMSAHKAKGLEFEAVFVVDVEESVWAKSRTKGVPLPSNLSISPAGDNQDDQLRLFYVVATRAKRHLYFLSSARDRRGKQNEPLGFLAPEEGSPAPFETEVVIADTVAATPEAFLVGTLRAPYAGPFTPDEQALLMPLLEQYQMSVTHLQNFLDVAHAGPAVFFQRNFLRFPEPKTPNGAFGSAIHKTIENIFGHVKSEHAMPKESDILAWFERALKRERLNAHDFKRMLAHGEKVLPPFFAAKRDMFSETDLVERNFRDQGVIVNGVPLTGKIDYMRLTGGEIAVSDWKTGRALMSWEPKDPEEKIKAWKYRRQLVFYKVLIENSREFGVAEAEGGAGSPHVVTRGTLQFVEPYKGQLQELPLTIAQSEVDHLVKLIHAVHQKIQSLDFPDTSGYPKTLEGILRFEEDLMGEKG